MSKPVDEFHGVGQLSSPGSAEAGLPCFGPLPPAQLRRLSPSALAYIGDAVYELFIRRACLMPPKKAKAYHLQVVSHVRAEQQAQYLDLLKGYLTEAEAEIVRRGRNAVTNQSRRANGQAYQQATGLEALIGYLYLSDSSRLMELLRYLPLDMSEGL